ncbi:MAG: pentapeptide repeat-containing protein [Deltaproteobacteria bacterium]|nr:pentapeptide repeat-containing protein [Deltaproteobacteria bacterium]
MDLQAMLANGEIEAFNKARDEVRRVELFAADLPGAPMARADLSGADMAKSDLSEADLTGATLVKANLSGIDGGQLKLTQALAVRVNLGEAWLEEADLSGGDFTKANFTEASLSRTVAVGAVFTRANLKQAEAREARWEGADLREAQINGADFTGAVLSGAILSEAHGARVQLQGARLDRCEAVNARLAGAQLQGADLTGARMAGVNLVGADLTGARMAGCDLTGANLQDAILAGADLTGAVLAGAALDGVALDGISLEEVDLTGLDPRLLGLDQDRIDALAAWGAVYDPDGPVLMEGVVAARSGDTVAVAWRNPEPSDDEPVEPEVGEEPPAIPATVRWAVVRGDARVQGVLPFAEDELLSISLAADGEIFRLLAVQRRPVGVFLLSWELTLAGASIPVMVPLGYAPMASPVLAVIDRKTWLWGLSSRGPGLVAQQLVEGRLETGFTAKLQTARAFLGANRPVLESKGGVLIGADTEGAWEPLRVPASFPGDRGAATALGDKILVAWVEPRVSDERPGGMRAAWISRREPVVERIWGWESRVESLSLWTEGERTWMLWTEPGGVRAACPPEQERIELPLLRGEDAFFGGGTAPVVVAAAAMGGGRLLDLDGTVLGRIAPAWRED